MITVSFALSTIADIGDMLNHVAKSTLTDASQLVFQVFLYTPISIVTFLTLTILSGFLRNLLLVLMLVVSVFVCVFTLIKGPLRFQEQESNILLNNLLASFKDVNSKQIK